MTFNGTFIVFHYFWWNFKARWKFHCFRLLHIKYSLVFIDFSNFFKFTLKISQSRHFPLKKVLRNLTTEFSSQVKAGHFYSNIFMTFSYKIKTTTTKTTIRRRRSRKSSGRDNLWALGREEVNRFYENRPASFEWKTRILKIKDVREKGISLRKKSWRNW